MIGAAANVIGLQIPPARTGGFAFHVGGSLIHALLVIAVIVLVVQLITGRRAI